ncbi:hypothetical protein [Lysobacter sp. N42]|uniref:hypothetical protein n=1 Tax=Lysobacter sp. N42 TaxID=2545719 RepID=UPI0010454429|nr:hypothetical protein [Lysobacter sp. N42]TCZ76923.1 hypothetical protein EYQ95_26145 [Lysobacter sp. N42]
MLALVGCSNAPERTRIEAGSVETSASGGLKAAIGIAAGSRLVPVLDTDCHLPCSTTQVIRPASADQQEIAFWLYQGTGSELVDATPLGTYRVSWAEQSERPSQIEVTFTAEPDGIFLHAKGQPNGGALPVTRDAP